MEGAIPNEVVILPFIDDKGVWDWGGSRCEVNENGIGGDEM